MKPPAFQFYADDFLGGVADMTQAEVGAYILLLCHQWSRGEIPSDQVRASLIAKGKLSPHVLSKFPDGKNIRMEKERQKQAEYRQKQSDKGKASAKARLNRGSTAAQPEGLPNGNSPSPSPSPSPIKNTNTQTDQLPPVPHRIPTLDEWKAYCLAKYPDWPEADATSAWEHYESLGWKKGKTLVQKWKLCASTCYRNWREGGARRGPASAKPLPESFMHILTHGGSLDPTP